MNGDIDPSQFADESFVGGDPTDDHQNGIEKPPGRGNALKDALLSTYEPSTSPGELSRKYEVSKGMGFILYGVLQAAGSGNMPAIGNLSVGLFLESKGWLAERSSSSSSSASEPDDELPENDIAKLQ